MKWGGKYGPHYVNALREGVSRHLTAPFRFLCLTDDAAGLKTGIESAPTGIQTPTPRYWWLSTAGWKLVAGEYVKSAYYWTYY